ncbi:hypothetical protein NLI96_g9540 [Meripilus lineatus]|uniref:Thioesterase domain-containing protein n=1 Tax=Meripilus lineatus TaxID=2056292 RepID=A0AAD5UXI0_9APHY|nr:hypothetical protein NLI96_g9540 [Physisporinus lineatus]
MFSALARRHAARTPRLAARLSTSSGSTSSASSSGQVFRYLRMASLASGIAATSYTVGSLYPPALATFISPRSAPPPPDPNEPSSIAYVEALEESLHNLPLLKNHRTSEDAHEWYETRPYISIPEERRANNLTAGALRGPGKLALPPLVRAKKDESENWLFLHVGRGLCGHDGIVHGGLLATLLDESLARVAILNLPDKIGVTANLTLNYRAPTHADQFIVIKTKLVESKGRKTKVTGTVEDLEGNVLVEASALFVQPRYSKLLNTKQIKEVMGVPPEGAAVAPIAIPPAISVKA